MARASWRPDRIGRTWLVLLLLALLGGCWYSDAPLIDAGHAVEVPFAGAYADPDHGPAAFRITALPDREYRFEQGSEQAKVRFLALEGGWYLYQIVDAQQADAGAGKQTSTLTFYNLVKWSGGHLVVHNPVCNASIDAIRGIEDTGEGCRITGIRALKAAGRKQARALDRGALTTDSQALVPWPGP